MASFVVSKPANSFDALLERAARQLPLNSPVDVTAMRDLLSKVIEYSCLFSLARNDVAYFSCLRMKNSSYSPPMHMMRQFCLACSEH